TSFKKFTCSQGESKQAPLPHTSSGNAFFSLKILISCGAKTVWVGSEGSVIIKALYFPVPPFSITRETISSASKGLAQDNINNKTIELIFFMFRFSPGWCFFIDGNNDLSPRSQLIEHQNFYSSTHSTRMKTFTLICAYPLRTS